MSIPRPTAITKGMRNNNWLKEIAESITNKGVCRIPMIGLDQDASAASYGLCRE